MRNKNKPEETVESLRTLKRRIYLWALIAGFPATLLGWLPKAFAGSTTSYEQVIFPATVALCLSVPPTRSSMSDSSQPVLGLRSIVRKNLGGGLAQTR
ncbi:MAG: hypothetical protein FJZ86_00415 [Chloroflexi bacterium]|nr:hypothetical protein [Chloroflexota bacterium]